MNPAQGVWLSFAAAFTIIAVTAGADSTGRTTLPTAATPVPTPSAKPIISLQPMVLITGGTGMVKVSTGENPAVLNSAEVYTLSTASSAAISSMATNRSHHSAVPIPNGGVLIIGGINALFVPVFSGPTAPWILASTDSFDVGTGRFHSGTNMMAPRDSPSAVMLGNGKILVLGGGTSSAELYDPCTGKFSTTGAMAVERYGQTATLLTDGKVLVVGGGSSQAELYDPDSGKFDAAGHLDQNRIFHTATLLLDGRVLIVGGSPYARSSATDTTELYDPLSRSFQPGPKMLESRASHTATLLSNGEVLIAGGHDDNSAEIYDPVAEQFTAAGNMSVSRFGHSATRWPDGKVLIAGGWNKTYQPLATTEIYDMKTGAFTASGTMTEARADHTATLVWVKSPVNWSRPALSPTPSSTPSALPVPALAAPQSNSAGSPPGEPAAAKSTQTKTATPVPK